MTSLPTFDRFPFDGLGPWARQVWEQHYHCFYMGWTEVMHIAAMAIGLTVLRMVLNFVLLEVKTSTQDERHIALTTYNVHAFNTYRLLIRIE